MEQKDYLAYIAHFIKSNRDFTDSEYRKYFTEKLGSKLLKSSKVPDLAHHLYIAFIVHLFTRFSAMYLATRLTTDQLKDLLADQIKLNKKYKIFYEVVDRNLDEDHIDKIIKERGDKEYKSTFDKLFPVEEPKKTSTKKPSTKKSSPKKGSKKGCDEYLLKELREKIKEKKEKSKDSKRYSGYSKWNKSRLCEELNIK